MQYFLKFFEAESKFYYFEVHLKFIIGILVRFRLNPQMEISYLHSLNTDHLWYPNLDIDQETFVYQWSTLSLL